MNAFLGFRTGLGFVVLFGVVGVACSGDESGDGAPGSGLQQRADQVCAEMDALGCGADCPGAMSESIEESHGCESELAAILDCALEHPMTCGSATMADTPAECDSLVATYTACLPSCSGGGSADTCNMTCTGGKLPEWGAECTSSGDQLECTCTSGANTGKTFTITGVCAGSSEWESGARAECS